MSMTIAGAKRFLEEQGYYTECLWNISDVQQNWGCTDEQAQEILSQAFNSERITEEIFFSIDDSAIDMGLERINIDL